ncbi:MAG: hypothetical protein ACLFQV_00735 [Vulcanimicrobiota bacterium]
MALLGTILAVVGGVMALVGWIMLLIIMFRKHILWGIIGILLPWIGGIIFAVLNWDISRGPIMYYILGTVLAIIGAAMGGTGIFQNVTPGLLI